jgi:hypothetical protein
MSSIPRLIHPAADAFPMLSAAEYRQLRDDININGVRVPVLMTPDGLVLDGRNRLRACDELGIDPPIETYHGDPVACVISLNLARRHLNESQRAMIAAKLATMKPWRPNKISAQICALIPDLVPATPEPPKISQPAAAEMMGVSPRSVQSAAAVQKAVVDGELDPKWEDDILHGRKTINKAQQELKQRRQQKQIEQVKAEPIENRFALVHTAIADWHPEDRFDAIVTDPPYPREYLPVYADLAHFARRALKPGGSLFVMIGQSYLPEILALMTPIIPYHWTLSYLTPGGQAVQLWQRNVNTFWKPILWFVNGDYEGPWHGDVAKSDPNDNDKRFHHWGQSLSGMVNLIEKHTQAGDLVCDPFCGGGATGAACIVTGRRFIGADIDAAHIATSNERLCAL